MHSRKSRVAPPRPRRRSKKRLTVAKKKKALVSCCYCVKKFQRESGFHRHANHYHKDEVTAEWLSCQSCRYFSSPECRCLHR